MLTGLPDFGYTSSHRGSGGSGRGLAMSHERDMRKEVNRGGPHLHPPFSPVSAKVAGPVTKHATGEGWVVCSYRPVVRAFGRELSASIA